MLGVVFLIGISYFYENKVFYTSFVDEQDNIVLGSFLLKGQQLYSDLFTHHQPLMYIFSAWLQGLMDPQNLYILIKRSREFIILWSAFWSLFLIGRFGLPLLFFTIVYESTKFFIFGNMFLAESVVIYPLVYLTLATLEINNNMSKYELFFVGVCITLVGLLLATLWPLLAVLFLLVIFIIKDKGKLLYFALGFVPLMVITFYYIDSKGYFYDTFFVNYHYYIPIAKESSFVNALLYSFITPILPFILGENATPMLRIIRIISVAFLFVCGYMLYNKKYKGVLLIIITLGLTNLRMVSPGSEIYQGFHLLQWYALIIAFTFIAIGKSFIFTHKRFLKVLFIVFLSLPLLIGLYLSKDYLFILRDRETDFYINYSRINDIGEAIKILKEGDDELYLLSEDWLLYWTGDINHASNIMAYLPWMAKVPEFKGSRYDEIKKTSPEFVYCEQCGQEFIKFNSEFVPLKRDGKLSGLYIVKERTVDLTTNQKERLRTYHYSF